MKKPTIHLLKKAQNALNSGNIGSAKTHIKKIKNYTHNADALNILALCHAIKNEFSQAEKLFLKSINLSDPTEFILGNLGLAQLHQQKIHEAINSFLSVIKLNPDYYDALRNLAVCYDYTNDRINAIKYAQIANNIKPDDPEIINIIAKYSLYNRDIQGSITLYKRSLYLQPQQPFIYNELANAHIIAKAYDDAEKVFKDSIKRFPDIALPRNSLANYYEVRNRYNDAIHEYEKVITMHSENTVAIAGKSRCMVALKQFSSAGNILHQNYKQFPDSPEIGSELCNYLILMKDYEAAYNVSRKLLSSLKTGSLPPVKIVLSHSVACRHSNRLEEAKETLLSTLSTGTITKESQELLHFSLADILDNMKQYTAAFNHYRLANEAIPRPSDITYYESVLTDITATVDRDFLNSISSSGNESTLPVFIVGMPRSGTSLVEQILSSHPEVYGAGELTDLWGIGNKISGAMNLINYTKNLSNIKQNKLKEFSETYINNLHGLIDNEIRVTDKLPHNFMHIGLIEKLFPNAKIIHCQRHPFDTCLSIYFKKFNDNHVYSQSLKELARFYKKYITLMEHWYENSSLSILTVNYADMVLNQEVESRRLFEHLGLCWSDNALRFYDSGRIIMTPSSHQASKPIYKDSLNRWKNYTGYVQPLEKVLGDPNIYLSR